MAEGGGEGATGIIIFTLWYLGIAFNYAIAPIFDRSHTCQCKCRRTPCLASSNSCDSLPDTSKKLPDDEPKPKPKEVEKERPVKKQELLKIPVVNQFDEIIRSPDEIIKELDEVVNQPEEIIDEPTEVLDEKSLPFEDVLDS